MASEANVRDVPWTLQNAHSHAHVVESHSSCGASRLTRKSAPTTIAAPPGPRGRAGSLPPCRGQSSARPSG